jgi:hypothetical protein
VSQSEYGCCRQILQGVGVCPNYLVFRSQTVGGTVPAPGSGVQSDHQTVDGTPWRVTF